MADHEAEYARNARGTIETGKAGVSDTETLAAEPGQSVAEPADRVMNPGTLSSHQESKAGAEAHACCGCFTNNNLPCCNEGHSDGPPFCEVKGCRGRWQWPDEKHTLCDLQRYRPAVEGGGGRG